MALELTDEAASAFVDDARTLVANYFLLEDPDAVRDVGVELGLEADVAGMRLRGIIDRLDLTETGDLVVIDYKTGRAPSARFERGRAVGGPHLRPACASACSAARRSRSACCTCVTR